MIRLRHIYLEMQYLYKAAIILFLVKIFLAPASAAAASPPFHTGRIIPNPRTASYGDYFSVFQSSTGAKESGRKFFSGTERESEQKLKRILIITEGDDKSLTYRTAEELSSFLNGLCPPAKEISISSAVPNNLRNYSLVIALGQPAKDLLRRNAPAGASELPGHDEGYVLLTEAGKPSLALADAMTSRGIFYASRSLKQLFVCRNGNLMLKQAMVRDWPAYSLRVSGNDERFAGGQVPLDAVSWFSFFKLSGWATGQSYWWPENWREMPESEWNALSSAAEKAGDGRLSLMYQVHPFGRANDPEKRYTIRISEKNERDLLFQACRDILLRGARDIMVRADDFHALSDADEKAYPDRATAHITLLNDLYSRLSENFPQFRLYFCPPYYHGNALDNEEQEAYLRSIGEKLHPDIRLVWTGPEIISRSFSPEDTVKYREATGRSPVLWDNTVFSVENRFGYPYKFAFYLFHPFEPATPASYQVQSEGIRFNYGFDGSEISKVANVVLADYLWNPLDYDPEKSLRNAIAVTAGPRAVDTVLELASGLRLIFDISHSPAYLLSIPPPPSEKRFLEMLSTLENRTLNKAFSEEMKGQFYNRRLEIQAIEKIVSGISDIRDNALISLDMNDPSWQSSINGSWSITRRHGTAMFSFPYETKSFAGANAGLSRRFSAPPSPTGRYYLHFIADDDYRPAGDPPRSWPGFFFREIMINGEQVWEEDVTNPDYRGIREIDISRHLGKEENLIRIGARDRQGVYNLGVKTSFSRLFISHSSLEELAEKKASTQNKSNDN